jgi:hypothetical protein
MTWFYSKYGHQLGPISEEDFSKKCSSGEILRTDLVWKEGMSDWLPLAQVTGLSLTQVITPIDLTKPPESNLVGVMMEQPPPVDVRYIPQRFPNYQWQSIVALVLSCIQMMFICIPLGLVFAIIAMVYSNKVEPFFIQQNYLAAQDSSKNAKIFMILSLSMSGLFVFGFISIIVILLVSS